MTAASDKPSNVLRHSSIYALGNLSRQLVSFLMLPVYTRFLTPADYGVVGLLTLSMSLIEPFLGARLGDAIPRFYFLEKEEEKQKAVISTAFMVTLTISLATVILLFFLKNFISLTIFGTQKYTMEVGVFSLLFLTQALEYYGFTFIRIQQKPNLFISLSIGKMALQIILNIWLIVILKSGAMGMVISNTVSSSIICLIVSGYSLRLTGLHFNKNLATQLLKFSWPLWISGLANLYIYASNRYLIRIFGSIDQVGLYELAARLAAVLAVLVWSPFYQYWETEQFRIQHKEDATTTFSITFTLTFLALTVVTNGISIFSYPVIKMMAAPQFYDAAFSVSFLTIGSMFTSLVTFISFGFFAAGKTGSISKINIGSAILVSSLNYALIPRFGFYGAAVALMLTLGCQFITSSIFSQKLFNMNVSIFPPLLTAIALLVTNQLAKSIDYNSNLPLAFLSSSALFLISSAAMTTLIFSTSSHSNKIIGTLKLRIQQYREKLAYAQSKK